MSERPSVPEVPDSLSRLVEFVGAPVGPEDIELYGQYREIVDKSQKLRTILDSWERQHQQERSLRRTYARWLMWAVTLQALAANAAFFLIGAGVLTVEPWVGSTFIAAVFVEITGLAVIVVKYLFGRTADEILSLLARRD